MSQDNSLPSNSELYVALELTLGLAGFTVNLSMTTALVAPVYKWNVEALSTK